MSDMVRKDSVDLVKNGPIFEAIAQQVVMFQPSDIYNCDETGLYLKVLSNKSLSQNRVLGKKPNTEARISILLC